MNERMDAVAIAAGKAAAVGGGTSAFVFGLSANEFAAVVGAVVAVLGWLTQMYFNLRRDRRERRESEARLAGYKERGAANPKVLVGALAAAAAVAAFIVPWEGNELAPYQDVVGFWTVCAGVTGPDAQPGRTYTEAECNALNTDAIAKHLQGVAQCIHRPLRENEWVAIGSWTYNVGVSAACKSTLVRKLNAGQPWCAELLRWDYAGGKRVRGLTNRRKAEYLECVK